MYRSTRWSGSKTQPAEWFPLPIRRLPALSIPESAYDAKRGQYQSVEIMKMLAQHAPSDASRILGVTDVDLAIPMLSFLFGQAQFDGPIAVVSLCRLHQEFYGLPPQESLLRERTAKEVLHELGHTFGLVHCSDPRCAMSLATHIELVDAKRRTVLRALRDAVSAEVYCERGNSMKKNWPILVVDDEEVMCESMGAWLREDGYHVDTAPDGQKAVELAKSTDYAICFVDLKMPGGMDGIETMMEIHHVRPEASIIIITAYATVDTAIQAMKEGAQEYIVKPCNPQEISMLVSRILKLKKLQSENAILRKKLNRHYRHSDIITKNPRMGEILALTQDVASLRSTVLIRGESGTGKELVARAVHFSGNRAEKPFIVVSCAALTETLLESELFGYEKGAFTGAAAQAKGKFELADGGTIFLDEIGDISPKLQADLLRVLQERRFYRVGGNQEVEVDVRIIAATNKNLAEEVQQGRFREDLYYRLNVIEIHLPPLRERREDIPLLAEHFVQHISSALGKDVSGISASALKLLIAYDWPGNVRELENVIERAIVTCRNGTLDEQDFSWLQQNTGQRQNWEVPGCASRRTGTEGDRGRAGAETRECERGFNRPGH